MSRRMSARERFDAAYAVAETGCWLWTRYIRPDGYTYIYADGRQVQGHRYAYETFVGPIPEGLVIDHLCRVRHCVNPAHMEPVTAEENARRSPFRIADLGAAKTHCPRGHAYSPENTYVWRGHRQCRTCNRREAVASYARRRAKDAS